MFRRFQEMREREEGFTLIELLVVILIIAILAAIAIPVFLRQREKGYVADVQSTLKNWATAVESASTTTTPPGDYSQITAGILAEKEDAKKPTTQTVTYYWAADKKSFCLKVVETRLGTATGSHDWQTATYKSSEGRPSSNDTCTGTEAGSV